MGPEQSRTQVRVEDLAHRLRRLHFFNDHFRNEMAAVAARAGLSVSLDSVRLTEAFLAWGEDFMRQRDAAAIDRRDYMIFTAGTLLKHLIDLDPIAVQPLTAGETGLQPPADMRAIIDFWPQGFLYTTYCISVLQTVIEQETGNALPMSEVASDLRNWWSFRENVREDRSSAIGFFDLFVGSEPNWLAPSIAADRPAMRRPLAKPGRPAAVAPPENEHTG